MPRPLGEAERAGAGVRRELRPTATRSAGRAMASSTGCGPAGPGRDRVLMLVLAGGEPATPRTRSRRSSGDQRHGDQVASRVGDHPEGGVGHGSKLGRFVVVASHSSNVSRSRADHSRKASSFRDGRSTRPGTPPRSRPGRRTPWAVGVRGGGALRQLEYPAGPADAIAELLEQPVAGRPSGTGEPRSASPSHGPAPAASGRARCRCHGRAAREDSRVSALGERRVGVRHQPVALEDADGLAAASTPTAASRRRCPPPRSPPRRRRQPPGRRDRRDHGRTRSAREGAG